MEDFVRNTIHPLLCAKTFQRGENALAMNSRQVWTLSLAPAGRRNGGKVHFDTDTLARARGLLLRRFPRGGLKVRVVLIKMGVGLGGR